MNPALACEEVPLIIIGEGCNVPVGRLQSFSQFETIRLAFQPEPTIGRTDVNLYGCSDSLQMIKGLPVSRNPDRRRHPGRH